MRMRTFTAPDMNRAMLMIREALGDDAVIISTERDGGGKNVSVTAAVEEEWEAAHPGEPLYDPNGEHDHIPEEVFQEPEFDEASEWEQNARLHLAEVHYTKPPLMSHDAILQNRDLAFRLNEIEKVLNYHSAPKVLVDKMLAVAKHVDFGVARTQDSAHDALADLLSHLYKFEPLALEQAPERILLVGAPGAGKTMLAAKIAAHMATDRLPIRMVTIDNKRAGSVEQLRAFTSILRLQVDVAESRSELRNLLKSIPASVPVLIDSFATNPFDFEALRELNEFATLSGVEPVLVMPAGLDAQEAADTVRAFSFMSIRRIAISRIDAARRFAGVLAAAEAGNLAFCHMTQSAQVIGGLQAISADALAQKLLAFEQGE